MSEAPEKDQKTEQPTDKRRRDAAQKGDVLQSKELATALVMLAGAAWMALAGPMLVGTLETMLIDGLTFDAGDIRNFEPRDAALRLAGIAIVPLITLFALTILAAIGSSAMLGSFGFRTGAFAPKPEKLNPLSGLKRIFGVQGVIELVKSLAKVCVLGAVGYWLLNDQFNQMMGLASSDVRPAIVTLGNTFILAVLAMALALALIALIDVPAQIFQRGGRLRMSKQEVKDESKQTDGSPELKAAIRRRQHEVLRGSARTAVQEATVVLTNPTHFAVALRYRPGTDAAPIVVARGRGATAAAIRELAGEHEVPVLSYPQLARAIYYTARTGQVIREDLYMAVATVLAFVFNLDRIVAEGGIQPDIEVPTGARFDEKGRAEA
ncbi:flagellar type III secretion system protein FlhB [Sphingosinicella sp. LY1275]|uniref:flagellar type III secretion system protein FlhB n=1 Tax=Sphingosinicella sp. LY1275 TaxID=3095379 RepID=UPI002ADEEFE0|nr:flagellar type III secretion system protein FlhB [Sphingosinicella sp. LY1275]MEA1015956.1 flagellar type III secretion system protein FlhB [Sphingosinicella sp. LY1275]